MVCHSNARARSIRDIERVTGRVQVLFLIFPAFTTKYTDLRSKQRTDSTRYVESASLWLGVTSKR